AVDHSVALVLHTHSLDTSGELFPSHAPYACRPGADAFHLLRASVPAPFFFPVDAPAQLRRRFYCSYIRGGSFIAHRMTLLINCRLREYTTQLSLAGVGLACGGFATPPLSLTFHYRHARAVEAHIRLSYHFQSHYLL